MLFHLCLLWRRQRQQACFSLRYHFAFSLSKWAVPRVSSFCITWDHPHMHEIYLLTIFRLINFFFINYTCLDFTFIVTKHVINRLLNIFQTKEEETTEKKTNRSDDDVEKTLKGICSGRSVKLSFFFDSFTILGWSFHHHLWACVFSVRSMRRAWSRRRFSFISTEHVPIMLRQFILCDEYFSFLF